MCESKMRKVRPDFSMSEISKLFEHPSQDPQNLVKVLDLLDCGIAKITFEGEFRRTVLWANRGFYRITGHSSEDYAAGHLAGDATNVIYPDDVKLFFKSFLSHVKSHNPLHIKYRIFHKKGHLVWIDLKSTFMGFEDELPVFITVINDITQEVFLQESLAVERHKYELITEISGETLFEYDVANDTLRRLSAGKSQAAKEQCSLVFNYLKAPSEGHLIHPDDLEKAREFFKRVAQKPKQVHESEEFRYYVKDKGYQWHRCTATGYEDPNTHKINILGKISNVHYFTSAIKRLSKENTHDALTGLYNKETLRKLIDEHLQKYPADPCALVLLDGDHFKNINDSFGHAFGDEVIKLMGKALQASLGHRALCGRFGGDEFEIFIPNAHVDEAKNCLDCFLYTLDLKRFELSRRLNLTCSFGIAMRFEVGNSYQELFEAADYALYEAKHRGRAQSYVAEKDYQQTKKS